MLRCWYRDTDEFFDCTGTQRPDISCVIAIRFLAKSSVTVFTPSTCEKCSSPHAHLGRILTLSGPSDLFVASASIMPSSSTHFILSVFLAPTFPTITQRERISH